MAYYKKHRQPKIPFFRRNSYIRTSPVRLIDEKGENVGVVETRKAQQMAYDAGLDLVEVSPDAKPPVCKIISWSKFKYELSKKRRSSSKGKSKEMKEMWFSPYIGKGDIDHKLKKVRGFLKDKHPVKMTIRVKGRVHNEVIYDQLEKILKLIKGEYITESNPRKEGRNLSIIILPPKSAKKEEKSEKTTPKTKKSSKE